MTQLTSYDPKLQYNKLNLRKNLFSNSCHTLFMNIANSLLKLSKIYYAFINNVHTLICSNYGTREICNIKL